MNALVEQEELHFKPKSGAFDVDRIAERISSLGYSFRDEIDPTMFVVCRDEASRELFRNERRRQPPADFPYVLLICVKPGKVSLYQLPGTAFDPLAEEFISWFVTQQPVSVVNESGTDLTDSIAT